MQIVGGLDVHRAQITFDCVDLRTGEEVRGQIKPATREEVRAFLAGFGGKARAFALEATTGWRFIVEELRRAGMETHLAEPADTRAARGRKRRAKTDRADARLLRDLLLAGEIPESWIPPDHLARSAHNGSVAKGAHLGADCVAPTHARAALPPRLGCSARVADECGTGVLERAILPPAARQVLTIGMSITDRIDSEIDTIDRQLVPLARRLPGCQVLTRQWGVGPVLAATILAELGDTRRFSSSRQAVRFAGLDVSVEDSDGKRPPGHLTRQGPPALRWALYEAATSAWRVASPDHDYYLAAKERIGTKRARISVARRILRRIHHELAECGDEAFAEAA